jgi:hypothetical protein
MKDIDIEIFEGAFSPIESKIKELQRIINPEIINKIKIKGKRIIKTEIISNTSKIYRIQK